MKRSSPPLHFFAAASSTTTMSLRPQPRGSRRSHSTRNPPSGDGGESTQQPHEKQYLIGSSNLNSNGRYRPSGNFPNYYRPYTPRPHPPPYEETQHFDRQQLPPPQSLHDRNPQFYGASQSFGSNQEHYRPLSQPRLVYEYNQQFRPPKQYRLRPHKPLDYRNWEYAKPEPPPHCERFTILTYNILADYLVATHRLKLYWHIPPQLLDWQRRKRSIIFELGLWSADILCFQEVDKFLELEEELKPRGYNGIWKMRTGDPVDGCAIFWRASRFKLLHEESIEFNKSGLRDNVAQICVLELTGCNGNYHESARSTRSTHHNRVVVCNIHVLFNPKRGEIKLGQVRELLDRAYAVAKLWDEAPVVICGDFNSTPKSPLYNFLAEQKLDLSELPRDKVSGQAVIQISSPRPSSYSRAQYAANAAGDSPATSKKETTGVSSPPSAKDACQVKLMMNGFSEASMAGGNCSDDVPSRETSHRVDHMSISDAKYGDSPSVLSDLKLPHESTVIELPLDNTLERSSIDEVFGGSRDYDSLGEDCGTSLSNLQADSPNPSDFQEVNRPEVRELNSSFKELSLNKIPDGSPVEDLEANDLERLAYNPSTWTPEEIKTATGSSDCKVMEHPLKLKSTYAEVEDYSGTRDSSGEPLVTSYHRRFQGTVDYIWRSEGLQTVKVLAPIPKHAMQWTPGFPTKKWGSDHIALVSELAFTNDLSMLDTED